MRRRSKVQSSKLPAPWLSRVRGLVPPLLAWFARHSRELPWRRTRDPYAIWISEIMLQQTQVKTVIPYWERWMRQLPDVAALAQAGLQEVLKLWEGLGYYSRARHARDAARSILQRHSGRFPERFEDVLALPGIGRYTAGAICSIAFNQPTPVLDGNVTRVLARLFGIESNPREARTHAQLWELAAALVSAAAARKRRAAIDHPPSTIHSPCRNCSLLNQALMELGALVCTPRQPKCPECPVRRQCAAQQMKCAHELPHFGPRTKTLRRRVAAFVVEHRGCFLVRQRPKGGINSQLWEFPNLESDGLDGRGAEMAGLELGFRVESNEPLCVINHAITHHRIRLEAFRARLIQSKASGGRTWRWLGLHQLRKLPFPSAHAKILNHLRRV